MKRVAIYLLLSLGAIALLFPLWWMVTISLSTPGDAAQSAASASSFQWYPADPQWHNYRDALARIGGTPWIGFLDALANTIVITSLVVVGQVLSCSLVGFAFARMHFRGRDLLFVIMLATMMLPGQITMIPLFILFRSLGWIDTPLPLIVPAFFGSAFFIFLFRQFFAQQPEALIEAARIDGAGHLRTWWTVMLPLCRPVIAITAVFTFIGTWNDFLGPLIYLHSEDQATLAVALNAFRSEYKTNQDLQWLMAASVVTMLPCIILFFVAQKQFIGGLNLGAVKG